MIRPGRTPVLPYLLMLAAWFSIVLALLVVFLP